MKMKIDAERLSQEIEKSMNVIRWHAIESEAFCIFHHNGKQVQINVTHDPDDFLETVIDGIAIIEEEQHQIPTYPQHEKLNSIKDQSQAIGDFLEWLHSEKNSNNMSWPIPDGTAKERLLAEYFKIDLNALEAEKRAMLNSACARREDGGCAGHDC